MSAAGHVHGTRCWWDFTQAAWVCGPAPAASVGGAAAPSTAAADPPDAAVPLAPPAAELAGSPG
jgi:hypothetical protein